MTTASLAPTLAAFHSAAFSFDGFVTFASVIVLAMILNISASFDH